MTSILRLPDQWRAEAVASKPARCRHLVAWRQVEAASLVDHLLRQSQSDGECDAHDREAEDNGRQPNNFTQLFLYGDPHLLTPMNNVPIALSKEPSTLPVSGIIDANQSPICISKDHANGSASS